MNLSPCSAMTSNNDLTAQFLDDLSLDGCVIQAGAADRVDVYLTSKNVQEYLRSHEGENVYLLAGVPLAVGKRRASDKDILCKHYFYLDFDIRKFLKKHHAEEWSDIEVKEIGTGILHSLNGHPMLASWRWCVFTGNGIHVYYIGKPVEIPSAAQWQRGVREFFHMAEEVTGMEIDESCANPSKLSRLPGSNNVKTDRAIRTEILEKKDAQCDLSIIAQLGGGHDRNVTQHAESGMAASEGGRNTLLTSIAGTLRRRGLGESSLCAALSGINQSSCKPPLDQDEVMRIAKSVSRYPVSPSGNIAAEPISVPVLVRLKDVKSKEVRWLWQDRIPRGKLTLFSGNPGEGKSWCSLAVACAVTLGKALPGDEGSAVQSAPSKVLLLAAEDGPADTIRPRLEAMGADLSRVTAMTGVRDEKGNERHFTLSHDLKAVEDALKEGGYALVIIDPINAYLGDVDTHKDAAVRTVLTPLTKLAERYGVALVCIRHLTKSQRDLAIFRGQGSIGYTGAARAEHLIATHSENKQQRFMVCIKNNLVAKPPPISFEVSQDRFLWGDICNMSADALLAPAGRGGGHPALDDAVEFLESALANGGRDVAELHEEAEANGISKRTLNRAKKELGIEAQKQKGFGAEGGWLWQLPSAEDVSDTKEDLWHPLEETA
jgi:hypothetical protein